MNIGALDIGDYLAIGAIFSATDSVCTLQVLSQDETPLLYSLVFGEGVVNDATSVVLFNAIQKFDLVHIDLTVVLQFVANFFYLFLTSTLLGAVVSSDLIYYGSEVAVDSICGFYLPAVEGFWDRFGSHCTISRIILATLRCFRILLAVDLWRGLMFLCLPDAYEFLNGNEGGLDGISVWWLILLDDLICWHSTDREVALMILMAYLSYMLAEGSRQLPPPPAFFFFLATGQQLSSLPRSVSAHAFSEFRGEPLPPNSVCPGVWPALAILPVAPSGSVSLTSNTFRSFPDLEAEAARRNQQHYFRRL
ncbi:hypothetical protein ZIOFF_056121 [Zingiber officinale]|uniref:Cation/H+ exchanger transmembrane domain-containing protein n=1 Tax=Zingiber officinale TaxID=94328 RepID=A0A8J5KKU8_ZINOF|nr:hypothetical protein ZIOFF_056121 [Zingiber officinale]